MRCTLLALTIATLSLAVFAPVLADDEPADDAALARTAHRILRGQDEAAAEAVAALDETALRRLFAELRSQIEIRAALEKKRVQGLVWEDADLDTAFTYLTTVTGFRFALSEKARVEKFDEIVVSLHLDDVSVRTVLDLLSEPYGLTWAPQNGVVTFFTVDELSVPQEAPDAETAVLRQKIDLTPVSLIASNKAFAEIVQILQVQTGFNIHIDPRIAANVAENPVTGLSVDDVPLSTVLSMLCPAGGEDVVWTVRGNVILFTTNELLERD
ncbi:MAG: hypothetical protein ACYTG6_05355 [Planctomycetota bacterium]|jgi:hypothetical protein